MSKETCQDCGAKCCHSIAIEIEAPTTEEYRQYIRWYLAHNNISVFVEDGSWFVEFHTGCAKLLDDNACAIYAHRPKMCREYGYDEDNDVSCFISKLPFNYQYEFRSLEAFDAYLHKGQMEVSSEG